MYFLREYYILALRSMLHVECSIFFSSDIRTDMIGSSPRCIQIILVSTNNITFNMKDMTQIYLKRLNMAENKQHIKKD